MVRFLRPTAIMAILLSGAAAQTSNIIPADLQTGFNAKEVQVSFSNTAVDGFKDGTTFEKDGVHYQYTTHQAGAITDR
jgi:hypothetical protein